MPKNPDEIRVVVNVRIVTAKPPSAAANRRSKQRWESG
jgi:hypothetical protein